MTKFKRDKNGKLKNQIGKDGKKYLIPEDDEPEINGPVTKTIWEVVYKRKNYIVTAMVVGNDTECFWSISPKDKNRDIILDAVQEV